MSKVKKTITFDDMSEIQKQCDPPYENPIFRIKTVKAPPYKRRGVLCRTKNITAIPLMEYADQYTKLNRNDGCANETKPYLVWDAENSKYCCAPENMKDNDQFVLDKIKDAIQNSVENTCDWDVYTKYVSTNNKRLINNYIIIYKRLISSFNPELLPEEIETMVEEKKTELIELADFKPHGAYAEGCENEGEDDANLTRELKRATYHQTNDNERHTLAPDAPDRSSLLRPALVQVAPVAPVDGVGESVDVEKGLKGEGGYSKKSKKRRNYRTSRKKMY